MSSHASQNHFNRWLHLRVPLPPFFTPYLPPSSPLVPSSFHSIPFPFPSLPARLGGLVERCKLPAGEVLSTTHYLTILAHEHTSHLMITVLLIYAAGALSAAWEAIVPHRPDVGGGDSVLYGAVDILTWHAAYRSNDHVNSIKPVLLTYLRHTVLPQLSFTQTLKRQDRYALALRPVTLGHVNLHTDHTGRYTQTDRQTDRQTGSLRPCSEASHPRPREPTDRPHRCIHTQTDRQTDRQRNSGRDRYTHIQTGHQHIVVSAKTVNRRVFLNASVPL